MANAELRKGGLRIRIQEQPFQILAALLEQPGEVISRESLVRRLWPDGTFVDYERGLNAAVTRLRQTLSDSAESPRYVETVARRGYRFIAPVEAAAESITPPAAGTARTRRVPWIGLSLALLTIFVAAGAIWMFTRKQPAPDGAAKVTPITTYPGYEKSPSFSPDGNQVAFAWDQGSGEAQIYVKLIGPGDPLRLTSGTNAEYGPAWSPDGRQIAFLRKTGPNTMGVFVIPSLRGTERKVAEITQSLPNDQANTPAVPTRWVDWTADGRNLVVSGGQEENTQHGLFLLSLETGGRRWITDLPRSAEAADRSPAVSPDGRTVAFCRGNSTLTADLYVAPLSGSAGTSAGPRRLTADGGFCGSPVWTPDGGEVVFVSNRDGDMALWRVGVTGASTPRRQSGIAAGAWDPAGSRQGKLAYAQRFVDTNIWRCELASTRTIALPVSLIASTFEDRNPQYSPVDGRIAFQSSRSGNWEIWVCDGDGGNCWELTAMNGAHTGSPRWSPDGRQIAFDSAASGSFGIYVIDANGGAPRRLTDDPASDAAPSWSADGKWIYFSSARTGKNQIWKVPAAGGLAVQVTKEGGFTAFESPDGSALYYTRTNYFSTLLKSAPDGSGETVVAEGVLARGFVVRNDRLYYVQQEPGGAAAIRMLLFSTGKDSLIHLISKPVALGLSVSPDGKYILYSQTDHGGSDLMLVEHFK